MRGKQDVPVWTHAFLHLCQHNEPTMPTSKQQTLRRAATIVVFTLAGVAMMAWLYSDFDFRSLLEVVCHRDHALWMAAALLFGIVANVLRSVRWQMLLGSAGVEVRLKHAIELVFISYLINSVTPRLGELTRCLLLRRGNAAVASRALGTVVVEKLADVCCLLFVVAAAVTVRWSDTTALLGRMTGGLGQRLPGYAVALIIVGVACLLLAVSIPLRRRLHSFFSNLWRGMSAISRLKSPLRFVLLCAGIWLSNFLQLFLLVPCFESLSFVGWREALQVFAMASVGMLLPTPGGAGPWHYAIIETLTRIHNVGREVARGFALVTHGLRTLLVMLLGLVAYATFYGGMFLRARRHLRYKHQRNHT